MTAIRNGENLEIELAVPEKTTAIVELPQGYSSLESGDTTAETLILEAGHHKIVVR